MNQPHESSYPQSQQPVEPGWVPQGVPRPPYVWLPDGRQVRVRVKPTRHPGYGWWVASAVLAFAVAGYALAALAWVAAMLGLGVLMADAEQGEQGVHDLLEGFDLDGWLPSLMAAAVLVVGVSTLAGVLSAKGRPTGLWLCVVLALGLAASLVMLPTRLDGRTLLSIAELVALLGCPIAALRHPQRGVRHTGARGGDFGAPTGTPYP